MKNNTESKIKDSNLAKIQEEYAFYQKFLEVNKEVITANTEINPIRFYISLLYDYAIDIADLVAMNRNASVMPLTRIFIECYSEAKVLCMSYLESKEKYMEELKLLNAASVVQIIREYESITNDTTIDGFSKSSCVDKNLAIVENIISEFFPEKLKQIDENNYVESLVKIMKELRKFYKLPFTRSTRVENAFLNNSFLNGEVSGVKSHSYGYLSLYSSMCSASHNNIHTVQHRTLENTSCFSVVANNKKEENSFAFTTIIYMCLRDINSNLMDIIK